MLRKDAQTAVYEVRSESFIILSNETNSRTLWMFSNAADSFS